MYAQEVAWYGIIWGRPPQEGQGGGEGVGGKEKNLSRFPRPVNLASSVWRGCAHRAGTHTQSFANSYNPHHSWEGMGMGRGTQRGYSNYSLARVIVPLHCQTTDSH
jgi:hypothetical protein